MRDDFSAWWAVGSAATSPLVRMLFRVRVDGIDGVPAAGPAILAFNHVSVLDGPVLAIETAVRRRRGVRFLVAAEVFGHRLYGPVLRSFGQIPIRRGEADLGALGTAIEAVRGGALAAIAPEGRVGHAPDGALQRIRSGCARIALATGAPVVPVGIWGTQVRWPATGHARAPLTRRAPLRLAFGPSLCAARDDDLDSFGRRLAAALAEQVSRARAAT